MAKMDFIITEVVPVDPALGLCRARITVELKRDNNQPADGDVKIIAPGGQEITISTDPGKGTGRGELLFTSNAAVVVLTGEASIQGQLLTAHRPITLRSKSAKLIPDRVSANTAGGNGRYIFIVGVLDKDNAPVPDVPVRIINESDGTDVDNDQTNQHGSFVSKEITFPQSECSFLVIAGGLDPIQLKLDGPSRWRQAPIVPEPDVADVNQGLWHTITSAWCRGTKDLSTPPAGATPPSPPLRGFYPFLWRYIYRFRTNNNCRANTFLLLVTGFGLFWLTTFGITPETTGLSAVSRNIYETAGVKIPFSPSFGIIDWLKWAGWKFWWLCLGVAIIYRLIAWRDEVHRALQAARKHMAEIRQGIQDLTPAGASMSPGERLERPFGVSAWLRVFVREFIAAVSGDYLVGRR